MIIDTDFLINLMNKEKGACMKFEELDDSTEPLAISAVTIMQLFHGVARTSKPEAEEQKIHNVLHSLVIHNIDFEIARKAGKLEGELAKKRQDIGTADILIAATALSLNEPVLTRNSKDFSKIAGLEIATY